MGSKIALSLFFACLTFASVAHAEPTASQKETARSLMDQARILRDKGDLKGALQRFTAADAIMRVPTTGLEVARTQASAGLLVEARDTITRVMRIPQATNEPRPFKDARANAQQLDDQLETRIPSVTIVVRGAPQGTTPAITVDDVPIITEALVAPIKVDPGHHVIVAKTDLAEGRQELDLREAETKEVSVALVVIPGAVAKKPTEGRIESKPGQEGDAPVTEPRSHTLTYVAFGVAAVGAVVGTVTGIVSLSKTAALKDGCTADHLCLPPQHSDFETAHTMATVSTISFIGAGVAAGFGVVTLFMGKSSSTQPPAQASIAPFIGLGAAGVRGSF